MASRVIHLAIANEIIKEVQINDIERFRFGIILPDAYKHNIQSATDSHLKYSNEDGTKKTFKLAWFRETYGGLMNEDELYLGYYLHLIQDIVFRYFVYSLHNWDPYPNGNIERLHNDYRLLNNYVIDKYNITNSLIIPDDINDEPIFGIYPFDTEQLMSDFKTDFKSYNNGETFFFTKKMADDYIKMATEKSLVEVKALENGTSSIDELKWAWDKNPPKQNAFLKLKKLLK